MKMNLNGAYFRSAMDIDQTTKHYINNKVEVIKEIIKKVRGGNHVTSQNPEVNYEALAKYGRDLVEEVKNKVKWILL